VLKFVDESLGAFAGTFPNRSTSLLVDFKHAAVGFGSIHL
jgi:hypothetical protein